jgi:uncharacterized protein YegP (UPF0339 family)
LYGLGGCGAAARTVGYLPRIGRARRKRRGWRPSSSASRDPRGKYHLNLVAPNGQVIATSESYESKASALNGIEAVRSNAADAELHDQTSS